VAGRNRAQDRSLEALLLLRRHGRRLRTAQTVARLGEALRERTEQTGLEYAALVDDGTGEQVGEVLVGETSHVNLRPHLAALQPGRRYGHVHTHPGSTTFSDLDLGILSSAQ
jgi:Cu/Zn superoxide dismutase